MPAGTFLDGAAPGGAVLKTAAACDLINQRMPFYCLARAPGAESGPGFPGIVKIHLDLTDFLKYRLLPFHEKRG